MSEPDPPRPARGAAQAQAAAVAAIGAALFALALTQPAWIAGRIGPGLFAQAFAAGVLALSVGMGLRARRDRGATARARRPGGPAAGLAILAGVALFALAAREAGLVACCAAAAALTGFGAGERTPTALARAAGIGVVAAVAIGLTLLPEGAPLWP